MAGELTGHTDLRELDPERTRELGGVERRGGGYCDKQLVLLAAHGRLRGEDALDARQRARVDREGNGARPREVGRVGEQSVRHVDGGDGAMLGEPARFVEPRY